MRLVEMALGRPTDRPRSIAAASSRGGDLWRNAPQPATAHFAVQMTYCSDGRSGTVMVTGLPVRGSNRVMVIRTSHNSTPAVCHVGGTLPVPGKAHLPWIVCWSCAEGGRPRDPVAPSAPPMRPNLAAGSFGSTPGPLAK